MAAVLLLLGAVLARDVRVARAGAALPGPVAGSSEHVLAVGSARRSYRLYVPSRLPPGPVALVVMLHGGFGSARQAEHDYGWDRQAESGGFLVAYPDGLGRAWNAGGGCCGTSGRTGVDDVGFVRQVVAQVQALARVDPRRVYATGISNGGMLAYRLACDSRTFAAIGPDSATLLGGCPAPRPVSVIAIHGTADRNIPYLGGPGQGVARIDGPAVPAVVAGWRSVDGCAGATATRSGAVTTSIAACPQGRSVELVTIEGAGHQWPGAVRHPLREVVPGLDRPSGALDATSTIWTFFARHPAPS